MIKKDLQKLANKEKAKVLQGFFKTGSGQYGEGDVFLGIPVPEQRKVAKKYLDLSIKEVEELLHSKIHEHRLTALLIWTYQFEKASEEIRKKIYSAYLKNTKWINNWDLVDVTTPRIVGGYLLDKDRSVLYKLVNSDNLWERRISVLGTFMFIKYNQFKDSLKIAELLLDDSHDLIHKAVGWMLREVGKKDEKVLLKFLDKHYCDMPRTILRYSIERLSDTKKKYYMKRV